MRFGPVRIADAEGALLAHAVLAGERRFPKAHRVTADDVAVFREAGIAEVIAAVLERGDLDEDVAATRIAAAILSRNIEVKPAATGRVNLHAAVSGVFTVDAAIVEAINAIDPAITIATLADKAAVEPGRMVATVKIIPFAIAGHLVEEACAILAEEPLFEVHPFAAVRVGLVHTVLPGLKDSVVAKTTRITEERLGRSGSVVVGEKRAGHDAREVSAAIGEMLARSDVAIVFGASAMCDFDDVIPAAIRMAGGEVIRAGMPVDPGNLLVLGRIGGKTVIGAPGCARSPKENGFDWVLDRLLAGLDVTSRDIAGMGVGGLLMEIPTRPQPREARRPNGEAVHAVVLAAGRSTRMGGPNKLLARFGGVPLIRRVAESALASKAKSVTVVTGHQAERIRAALDGLDLRFAENPDFASGLASSLRAGVTALPVGSAGALVVLGDMPEVSTADLDRLIASFVASGGQQVVRASHGGKRGNPIILPRAMFAEVMRLEGDVGARHIIETGAVGVIDVEIGEGAFVDVDTAEAMAEAGGVLQD
ncbi:molybdopterin-binding/glycosyltransferase family 2 protein [Mesorhizobium sp. LHD-90]|uniref:molybdopterin-binding/glycosyltransferase family 2 protein n=1 Tax=Mesorhizobium sp. LHD-90 TaxID=3071414 RepID=UPI0027E1F772|nr:molybdopterin-binding/glycosyltransferase family 2 protein [Mesorhizobium sp. LHD-90]MDQ6437220.1 molybdopterin-binding/glycosyltransferase family 2 protein [Mesorhizobium sp. LHD-90]